MSIPAAPASMRGVSLTFPDFVWSSGEECSTPLVEYGGKTVRVDQLESTGHLERLEDDLADVASLGVEFFRYGMPWHRVELEPGVYDWSLWDRALAGCEKAGLEPIVDLVHFGLPDHYAGFCDRAWVRGLAEYTEAFLSRYPGPRYFTPVNEIAVTAMQSALIGSWNDRKRSPSDFARAVANCVEADLEAFALIREDRSGENIIAEGFSVPVGAPGTEKTVEQMRSMWWASWDLRFGFDIDGPAAAEFDRSVDDGQRVRIAELATTEATVAGHDFYPPSVIPIGVPMPETIRDRVEAYESEARRWYGRYGVDFWISETSNLSLPAEAAVEWLETLTTAVGRMREDGMPVRGICWYSRGDQHDWDTGLTVPVGKVTEVGLFDIDRHPRPVAEKFSELLARGAP